MSTATKTHERLLPSAGSFVVELDRVRRTADGKLLIEFSAGQRHWRIEVAGRQLDSFAKFRAAVADAIGLWIDHESVDWPRARTRAEEWEGAVARAFMEGAKAPTA